MSNLAKKVFSFAHCFDKIYRSREVKHLVKLNEHGVGIPLVASFENGLVLKYMKGTNQHFTQMKEPKRARYILTGYMLNKKEDIPHGDFGTVVG